MILDSSAILAVIFKEPDLKPLLDKIAEAPQVAIGAPTLAETGIVLSTRLGRSGRSGRSVLLELLKEWQVDVIPFGEDHWPEAVEAYWRFGRGRHRAGLNFGDCLTYAVAKVAGQPLACTGSDFSKTDLDLA
jgi:ribonuclease VapC